MKQPLEPGDIAVYVYEEAHALPRPERLTEAAAHYALNSGLASGGDFTVERKPGHKPYFPHQPELHFSISHSGDYWLVALHGAPLGLDIQRHTPRSYAAIAKRWFHPHEYAAVLRYGEARFFDIWSAKESFCKANGRGIDESFAKFSVAGPEGGLLEYCQGRPLLPFTLAGGYSACLCVTEAGRIRLIRV